MFAKSTVAKSADDKYVTQASSLQSLHAGNRTTQQKVEDTTPTTLAQYDYNYSPMGLPSNTYGYTRSENSAANIYTLHSQA